MAEGRSILIIGATGNTGRSVVRTLSAWLDGSAHLSNHRILAQTRSASGATAKTLAGLPHVTVIEHAWPTIDAAWLRSHNVARIFIASHIEPQQFAEESGFHLAALHAGVEYIVRISTTAANVAPDCKAYYPRTHWAIEQLLSAPEFASLKWSSLQPEVFNAFYLRPAAEFVREFRRSGKQTTLRLMADPDASSAPIDADDVGAFAAALLAQADVTPHHGQKYVLHGPEDVTGKQIVEMIEGYIGTKVEDVHYRDMKFIDDWAASVPDTAHLISSIRHAPETGWAGKTTADMTSKEVRELAPPRRTPAEAMKAMVEA